MSETTPDTAGTNGATVPPPELTAKEKRALREEARRAYKAAERERLEADAAKEKAAAEPAKGAAPAAQPADPNRSDKERSADAAVFLRGVVWPLVSVGAWVFGYEVGELTEAMAHEDASAWVPLARRYRWLDLLFTWASAPARLMRRVRDLAKPRPKKTEEPKP